METLNTYCFAEIFNYLHLNDLFMLRKVSRQLKQAVKDHLLTVRSLPLYLTTPRTPETIDAYYHVVQASHEYRELQKLSSELYLRRLSFGTSGRETWEDGTILQNQDHFRLADFLIINSSSALATLVSFMTKHCPNIEKLALVIDHCEHYLPEVSKVLKAFPKIKVLLVESTHQDSCRYDGDTPLTRHSALLGLTRLPRNIVIPQPEVYDSILAIDKLEELYFFPRQQSQLRWIDGDAESLNFVKSILRRVKVFHNNIHITSANQPLEFPFREMLQEGQCEVLEELACARFDWPTEEDDMPLFPALKKFIVLSYYKNYDYHQKYSFQNGAFQAFLGLALEFLEIPTLDIRIEDGRQRIVTLSHFPNLERLHCREFLTRYKFIRIEIEITEEMKNWTVKHLQVIKGPETAKERMGEVWKYRQIFMALETCVFLEPEYHEIRVSDLQE